jgi:hypothetical protein
VLCPGLLSLMLELYDVESIFGHYARMWILSVTNKRASTNVVQKQ